MTAADGTAPYVRRIRGVYPDLDVREARLVRGHGQNNVVLLVDDALVFRFPRYPAGIAQLEREVAVLRGIRGRVSLATPDPIYSAFAERAVGEVFVGYPMIPGEPLWQETLDAIGEAGVLAALGQRVGTFLRELHAVPVAEVLPDEAAAFDPLAAWRDLYARIRRVLFPRMRPDARAATAGHFEGFFDDPAGLPGSPVLVHGDFGHGNILYDPAACSITGVIDFASAGPGRPGGRLRGAPVVAAPVLRGNRVGVPGDRGRRRARPVLPGHVRAARSPFRGRAGGRGRAPPRDRRVPLNPTDGSRAGRYEGYPGEMRLIGPAVWPSIRARIPSQRVGGQG